MESTPSTLKHSDSAPPRPRGPSIEILKALRAKSRFKRSVPVMEKKDTFPFYENKQSLCQARSKHVQINRVVGLKIL